MGNKYNIPFFMRWGENYSPFLDELNVRWGKFIGFKRKVNSIKGVLNFIENFSQHETFN